MISSFIFSFVSLALLGYLINQTWFYNGLGVSQPSSHAALVLFSLTLPVFSFFITPISNLMSRKHEFQADAFAASHTDAKDLISSLIKLYKENSSSSLQINTTLLSMTLTQARFLELKDFNKLFA